MIPETSPLTSFRATPDAGPRDPRLWAAAQGLESAFLAEMLTAAGLDRARSAFGGGAGEEQFASFLRRAQADELVRGGGIGLAESLFQAMAGRSDG